MSDIAAMRSGYVIGQVVLLWGVSALTLYVNRHRRTNPTPYIAAGLICALPPFVLGDEAPLGFLSSYITWLSLLWRYKLVANVPPTGLARLNAIFLASLVLIAAANMSNQYGLSTIEAASVTGMCWIIAGLLWKWVRLVPLKK